MTLPESKWADALSARFAELMRKSPNPDPYANAHELAGAMVMPAEFIPRLMPQTPKPMRPDDELIPGRDDLNQENPE